MFRNSLYSIVLLTIILLTSCGKESTPAVCTFQNSTFVGSWKLTKVTSNGQDITSSFFDTDPCLKTYVTQYNSNQTFTAKNTVSSCTDSENGTWLLSTSNSKNYLITKQGSLIDTAEVTNVSCTSFNVNQNSLIFTMTKE